MKIEDKRPYNYKRFRDIDYGTGDEKVIPLKNVKVIIGE